MGAGQTADFSIRDMSELKKTLAATLKRMGRDNPH